MAEHPGYDSQQEYAVNYAGAYFAVPGVFFVEVDRIVIAGNPRKGLYVMLGDELTGRKFVSDLNRGIGVRHGNGVRFGHSRTENI